TRRGPSRGETNSRAQALQLPGTRVSIARGSDVAARVFRENAELKRRERVLARRRRINADFDTGAPPMGLDVLGSDVGTDGVNGHVHEDLQALIVITSEEAPAAFLFPGHPTLDDIYVRNRRRRNPGVLPLIDGGIHSEWGREAFQRESRHHIELS